MKLLIACLAVMFVAAGQVQAGLLWDESIHGDLFGGGQNVGPFQLGTNVINGSTTLTRVGGNNVTFDADRAYIELVSGLQITSIRASVLSISEIGGTINGPVLGLNLSGPNTPRIWEKQLFADLVTTNTLPASQPSDYWMFVGFGASVQDDAELTLNWSVEFDVAPVPEPTSLAIFGLGALGLAGGAIRRRKVNRFG